MFAKGIFNSYGVLGIGLRLESLPEGVTLLIRNLRKNKQACDVENTPHGLCKSPDCLLRVS